MVACKGSVLIEIIHLVFCWFMIGSNLKLPYGISMHSSHQQGSRVRNDALL